MKHFLTFFTCFLISVAALAQSPEAFNYQGVARDNAGNVLANQNVGLKFSILDSDGTTVLYSEDQVATTNDFGLFNVQIGNGTVLSGTFSGIGWDNGARFVKVEMDPAGGTAYQNLGTSQLMSVPYALHANSSDDGLPGGSLGSTLAHNGSAWQANSNLYNDGTNVGIGTTTPSVKLEVKDDGSTPTKIVVSNSDPSGSQSIRFDKGAGTGEMWFNNSSNELTLKAIPSGSVLNLWGRNNDGITVDEDGNVGIGTSTPAEQLDVNGNVGFPSSGRSIIAQGAFNIESTTGVDVVIDNDDNSTNSSFRVKRNSDGSETIMEVKENGNVEVEGEYIYATEKTHYQSFAWNAFRSAKPQSYLFGQSSAASINDRYGVFVTGASFLGYAEAAVNLPDGANVTEIKAWVYDNENETYAIARVQFIAIQLGTDDGSQQGPSLESDGPNASASVQELTGAMNVTIDNSVNAYHIRFTGKQGSNDVRLYGVRLTYTVDQAD